MKEEREREAKSRRRCFFWSDLSGSETASDIKLSLRLLSSTKTQNAESCNQSERRRKARNKRVRLEEDGDSDNETLQELGSLYSGEKGRHFSENGAKYSAHNAVPSLSWVGARFWAEEGSFPKQVAWLALEQQTWQQTREMEMIEWICCWICALNFSFLSSHWIVTDTRHFIVWLVACLPVRQAGRTRLPLHRQRPIPRRQAPLPATPFRLHYANHFATNSYEWSEGGIVSLRVG